MRKCPGTFTPIYSPTVSLRAEKYKVFQGHKLPPECTPPVYNGECHVQFVRKMQASFGWDWGPSFPTVGIWRPVQLEYFDRLSIQSFSPMVNFEKDNFVISARLTLICAIVHRPIRVKLRLLELGMDKEFVPTIKKCPNWKLDGLKMKVPAKLVQLWHPIGYGTQPMYTLEVKIMENDFELAFARKRIAFRTVKLNQSLVNASDPAQGRLFQFELNGVPIFLKGTNWVPISLFPARNHSERRKFSLQSAVKANSNVLRWYPSWDYPEEAQARDYVRLYKTHIQTVAMALDPTRPVLLSSPSNGVETEREGGVSRNPADPAFGDMHFYTESVNLWKAYNYPVPRCASEFGVQSMPLRGTMARWLDPSDWTYRSATLVKRQHHPGGVLNLPLLVFQHFNIPLMNSSSTTAFTSRHDILSAVSHPAFMDQFAFISQIHQAVALQTQIEHYRRFRSHLNTAGLGRTMCAMYWQLNDVWAAPTWSTLDFDLRWKIGHHFFLDLNGRFRLWAVSDLLAPIQNANVRLSLFCFRSGLSPIFTGEVNWPSFASATDFSYDEGIYLLIADLIGPNGDLLSPRAVLYPDRLPRAGLYGNATISGLRDGPNGTYSVDITADDVLPLLWLDLSDAFKKKMLFPRHLRAIPSLSASPQTQKGSKFVKMTSF
uniref:beta-mannosidase n=1 Tax=Globodera pallida TaxID=36090 RepID=A0A183BHT4_GLOPA